MLSYPAATAPSHPLRPNISWGSIPTNHHTRRNAFCHTAYRPANLSLLYDASPSSQSNCKRRIPQDPRTTTIKRPSLRARNQHHLAPASLGQVESRVQSKRPWSAYFTHTNYCFATRKLCRSVSSSSSPVSYLSESMDQWPPPPEGSGAPHTAAPPKRPRADSGSSTSVESRSVTAFLCCEVCL